MAKCLTGRPKTVEKAQAAFMLWVELEAVDVFLVFSLSSNLSFFHYSMMTFKLFHAQSVGFLSGLLILCDAFLLI